MQQLDRGVQAARANPFPFHHIPNGRVRSGATRRSLSCKAAASVDAATAKQRIIELSGPKNGTDRTPEQKQAVVDVALELASSNRKDPIELTGSRWRLVFTESMDESSGRVGPFVGRTEQEFPADRPGEYTNWLFLGPVTISLVADYEQKSPKRVNVSFRSFNVAAGPFKWSKELKSKGMWEPVYQDEDTRILYGYGRKLFVLTRI